MSNTLFINNTKMHLRTFSLYLKVILVLFLASKKKQETNNIGEIEEDIDEDDYNILDYDSDDTENEYTETEPVVRNAGKSSKLEEQKRMWGNGKEGKKEV